MLVATMPQSREGAWPSRARVGAAADGESSVELLRRAQEGDDSAREALCARYLPRLKRFAHGRLPAQARTHLDTEDLVQDTLMHSVRRLNAIQPRHERAFCAYVCEALRNRIKDVARYVSIRPLSEGLSERHPAGDPSPLEAAVGWDTLVQYESALQRLSTTDRDLILAKVELGLDYGEIAELLGKPSLNATRVAMSRALIRLAREMSG